MNTPNSPDLNQLSAWQYDLPEDLIASRPTADRDGARLMVVRRQNATIEHHRIRDLPDLLPAGDRLVFNNTKVLPARLFGFRTSTGGRWEGLYLNAHPNGLWEITGQTRGRLTAGETLTVIPAEQAADRPSGASGARAADDRTLLLELVERQADGSWLVRPNRAGTPEQILSEFGTLPLPPYIGRKVADKQDQLRYQTTFAQQAGAIAAPTAGLHFTPELLDECRKRQIDRSEVTLHVGIGTFRPVNSERLSDHQMHSEWCTVSPEVAADIRQTRQQKGHVVAVGTTSVRTLEAHSRSGQLSAGSTDTSLFIRPGYEFRTVDRLLTNFHLPGSTLIVLVAALAGYDLTMEAYRVAVAARYRFYSYGDAMLIL